MKKESGRIIKFRAWGMSRQMTYFGLEGKPPSIYPEDPVMQFTGLKDKNGKEIWEGDVVRLSGGGREDLDGEICHVYYREDLAAFGMRNQKDIWAGQIGKSGMYGGIGAGRSAEVIGNIYENPELLK